jgi:hypothetical protein
MIRELGIIYPHKVFFLTNNVFVALFRVVPTLVNQNSKLICFIFKCLIAAVDKVISMNI